MQKIYLILLVFVFSACSSQVHKVETIDRDKLQVIFVPGFYGTRLKNKENNSIVWFNAGQAIWGSQTAAKTGFGIPNAIELVPDTILDKITVVPALYTIDFYAGFIKSFQNNFQQSAQLHLFPYDWRNDLSKTVQKLHQLVLQLKKQEAKSIAIVAHSFGGFLTSYYLRYGTQDPTTAVENWEGAKLINKTVLATVPFKGAMHPFRNVRFGVKFGLNTDVMSGDALSSFMSTYQLLPYFENTFLDQNANSLILSTLDQNLWEKHSWGFLKSKSKLSEAMKQHRWQFIQKSLAKSKQIYEKIHQSLKLTEPTSSELIYFYSGGHPTFAKVIYNKLPNDSAEILADPDEIKAKLKNFDTDQLFVDGDQTVTLDSAQLPLAFQQKFQNPSIHKTKLGHGEIYDDEKTQKLIFDFLRD